MPHAGACCVSRVAGHPRRGAGCQAGTWAERFDSHIRVQADGTLEVTETVRFRFEGGTFTHVFRLIPRRRTDGIEIVSAEMDGQPLTFGKGTGQVEVRPGSPTRVEWKFAPRQDSTNIFVLRYIVRGVVQRASDVDLLQWRALPSEHDYRIQSSEVVIDYPAALRSEPRVASRRVAELNVVPGERSVRILAHGIGRNGWVEPSLQFDEGSVIAAVPAWQARQLRAAAAAPRWATAALIVFASGFILMLALRQRYESPPKDTWSPARADAPPDTLRPAIAGALTTNGSVAIQHAMATLFALADRGDITIVEEPRKWAQRQYALNRIATPRPKAPEEQALLNIVFRLKGQHVDTVTLAKARNNVTRRIRDFQSAVRSELQALGMLDADRMRSRRDFLGFSLALLLIGAMLCVPAIILTRTYEGWPFLVVGAVFVVAIVGFVFYGSLTPLSNEGVRRADHWRAYRKYLRDVARDRMHLTAESPARLLPYAVTLGLAGAWSKFVKLHPTGIPPWFHALASTGAGDDGGFPAFIAYGGAVGDGGSSAAMSGAAGGAAGGGASGAG